MIPHRRAWRPRRRECVRRCARPQALATASGSGLSWVSTTARWCPLATGAVAQPSRSHERGGSSGGRSIHASKGHCPWKWDGTLPPRVGCATAQSGAVSGTLLPQALSRCKQARFPLAGFPSIPEPPGIAGHLPTADASGPISPLQTCACLSTRHRALHRIVQVERFERSMPKSHRDWLKVSS